MKWVLATLPLLIGLQGNIGRHWPPLPDVNFLRYEGVRKQIRLTPSQDAQVVSGFRNIQRLSDEVDILRKQMMQEMDQTEVSKRKALIDAFYPKEVKARVERKKVEVAILALISDRQRKRVAELQIQVGSPVMAQHPRVKPVLKVTAKQCQMLDAIQARWMAAERGRPKAMSRAEYRKWSAPFRRKYGAEMLAVLSKAQQAKLVTKGGKPCDHDRLLENRMTVSSTR